MTITEFLLARIAEDDAAARAAEWVPDPDDDDGDDYDNPWSTTHGEFAGRGGRIFAHTLRNNPTRVMAECAAKRAIIEDRAWIDRNTNDGEWAMGYSDANYRALKHVAAIYATHPDYDESWRP